MLVQHKTIKSSTCIASHLLLSHNCVPRYRAGESVYHSGEVDKQAAADKFDNTTMVLGEERSQKTLAECGDPPERSALIRTQQASVASHVGYEDCGKSAFQTLSPSTGRLTTIDRRIHADEKSFE